MNLLFHFIFFFTLSFSLHDLQASNKFTIRWYREQHIAAPGARIVQPRMEIADGALLVIGAVREAKLH